jgi:hypothetical protein
MQLLDFCQSITNTHLLSTVLSGEHCRGGGKLKYSVLTEVLTWSPALGGNSPIAEGNMGLKLNPVEEKNK